MKKKILLLSFGLICAGAQAQTPSLSGNLTLKSAQPKAGQEVQFTYNPTGTPLEKASAITALVYGYDGTKPKVQEVALTKGKAGWEGRYKPAPEVDGAILQFRQEETIENNGGKGYPFYFYDAKKQPVPGAYHGLASAYVEWGPMVEINRDPTKALELLAQETALYPNRKRDVLSSKINALSSAYKGEEAKQKVMAELEWLSSESNLTKQELSMLSNIYNRYEMKDKASAFANQLKAQEPTGDFVQTERLIAYYNEKDTDKRKEMALAFAADFPNHERIGNLVSGIVLEHAAEGNWQEFDAMLAKYPAVATSNTYNSAAWRLFEKGDNAAKAKALAKEGYDLAKKEVATPTGKKDDLTSETDWKRSREYTLGQVADTYGAILLKEGDHAAAEKYLAEGYTFTRGRSTGVNERYAEVLAKGKDTAKAQKAIEEMVASGNSTAKVKGYLKDIYAQKNNGETGFDTYYAKVEAPAVEKMRSDLKKKMILEKSPAFELLDLNGNVVSLASLKGKTVVVDFWATWCGPCISSFPGMQQAVNKYKENDKVAFVFVNSWENGKDKKKIASDFMTKKNYTFQVLMDEENKMIESFKVSGIPTKFILDGNGNIRFKSVGYSGNNEKSVQELSTMIDLLKPELLTAK